jgi:Cu/Ag efflux protein CusF
MIKLVTLFALSGALVAPLALAAAPPTRMEYTEELTATVKNIDLQDRLVTLQRPDGSLAVIDVDPSVRRLDEIRPGDRVHVKYTRALAVKIVKSTTKLSTTVTPTYSRSRGAFPGATASEQIQATVRIDGIDLANYTVTFTGESGESEVVYLSDAELRGNLPKLKLGDIVEVVYSEAAAVSVTPASDADT